MVKRLLSLVSLPAIVPLKKTRQPSSPQTTEDFAPAIRFNPDNLNCRAQILQPESEAILNVDIRGKIDHVEPGSRIKLHIRLKDITDSYQNPQPIYRATPILSSPGKKLFEHICELGKVPQQSIEIPDWISIAKIEAGWLSPPRKGQRKILMEANLHCCESSKQLTTARCIFDYEVSQTGYLDIQENIERTRALGVALTFAVSAIDGRMYKADIELVKQWARKNIRNSVETGKKNKQLERALNKTVAFFRRGKTVNAARLCAELTEIAPLAYRYDIIELCLNTVEAKGFVTARQLGLLKDIASWLQVNMARFRQMLERLAPAATLQVQDAELLFGLSDQMDTGQSLGQLNQEYRKWNARVTSVDPDVQNQAEQMLDLITQARSQYVS